ncbi:MAG: shikimate kinase [Pseudomonadota bacterium]
MGNKKLNQSIVPRLQKHSIVFVGMMGCGKSAIGRLVSQALALPYQDADEEIVTAAGMSIPDIFEQFGEEYFRKGENRVVSRLLTDGPAVLSLGGGAFINDETRELIKQNGISVWLKADLDLLMSRVLRRPSSRPLLKDANPRARMKELLETRTPIYSLADIHVESSRNSKNDTANAVIRSLKKWLDEHARQTAGQVKQ